MPLQSTLDNLTTRFHGSIQRALQLHVRVVDRGYWQDNLTRRRLQVPDQRDITQFLFFEVAALWEQFCLDCFILAARNRFGGGYEKAERICGSIDQGVERIGSWANPSILRDRARVLFGRRHCMSRLNTEPSPVHYQRLTQALVVRDRIAHPGGERSGNAFRDILTPMQVPQAGRQGINPGRLLLDYPSTAPPASRWFHRFLVSYREVSQHFDRHLLR